MGEASDIGKRATLSDDNAALLMGVKIGTIFCVLVRFTR
jgi:hypothetical protein